jgi:hypothetical protein
MTCLKGTGTRLERGHLREISYPGSCIKDWGAAIIDTSEQNYQSKEMIGAIEVFYVARTA